MQLPFSSTALSKENRQLVEDAVKKAKNGPDGRIHAIVIAGAYIGERDLDVLQDRRGEVVKTYLTKLGIPSANIYVEPATMTDSYLVKRPDGEVAVRQIEIELSPICRGSCEWKCADFTFWPSDTPGNH
ncbi:hypothetical protein [Paraburkholderia translucens]|uniref:hypothetical protein n=1 Tax=Paraburkholderia translucens TaxID=2886945 RepID=UPI001E57EB37|nr:hypothetical protein [Paraburkholderia sp. MMS20-SJTN17]